jgi:N-methylhydantoinase A
MPGADVSLGEAGDGDDGELERGTRTATLDGDEVALAVLRGSPPPGTTIKGPAVVELRESTLLVPAGWTGEVDDTGTIHIRTKPGD